MAFGSFDNRSSSSTVSEINMVPLIDVMLVLLVIFIITAPLLSHSIKINVPQATAQPVEQEPITIDLAVDAQGQLYWNEQAVRSAKSYLEMQHFSRAGLIKQLESAYGEQFTHSQAVYGVNKAGL